MASLLTTEDYTIISRLLLFFSTSYGPSGRLKLIQTLDHSMSTCTSMSTRIQRQLKCRSLISRLLSAAINKQISTYHDGGLYFSILFCSFLKQFRDLTSETNRSPVVLFEQCLDLLDQFVLPIETVTFSSIDQLLAIARSILCKPLIYSHSDALREQLCLLSVKSFLENMTMVNSSMQQLTLTVEGLPVEESTLINGLLFQTSTSLLLPSKTTRLCLYFATSLAGDYTVDDVDHIEMETQMFEWIQNTADQISKQIIAHTRLHHNGLILCQKVIHPSVKVKLKQYGIDTIDRLGRQYTPYLCYLTGCRPIETLNLRTVDERYFGTLTEIKQIQIESKQFLQFFNQIHPFHTLLLCANTEQSLLELKECMDATHHSLTNILQTKQTLYGGGCSESMQIFYLKSQPRTQYLSSVIRNVLRAQFDQDYVIDRIHGHVWLLADNDRISDRFALSLYISIYLSPMPQTIVERSVSQYDEIPKARSSHTLTAIDNNLYVFGGEHEPRVPIDNDVWQFSISDNHWKRLMVNSGDRPAARVGHAAAAVEHKLFIFGGRLSVDMKESTLNELYSFDVDLNEWTQYKKTSDAEPWPAKRSYHSMVSSVDQLFVFGGCGEEGRLNDLWQYDTCDKQWRQLPSPDPQKLVARGGCGLVYLNNALWVFGGFCGHELDDIASFDLVTQSWTYLTDAKISPRSVFACGSLNGVIIGHGGEQNPSQLGHAGAGEFANDVILIEPTKENGDRVQTQRLDFASPVGGNRGWHAGAVLKNTFYVFGGNTSENERDNSLLAIEFK
ncbi:unnamed protein product [Adineta ricciae]|uniref:Uncharacterized protein n=1 Tax=Adineta ricciae TaxID=249248 RepID=A0A813ZNJ6_ADIRI|nr:unnamed protein product [Adineta ricciae]